MIFFIEIIKTVICGWSTEEKKCKKKGDKMSYDRGHTNLGMTDNDEQGVQLKTFTTTNGSTNHENNTDGLKER